MFGCCYSLYGSKILKSFHFVTFWFDKWSAPRNYSRFRQIKKMKQFLKHIFKDIFFFVMSIPWVMICEMWIIRNIERYYIMKLVIVNFACYRRSLLLFVKQKKSQSMSTGQCPESNLSPLCLRLSFLPLSHWDKCNMRKLDDMFDSLSFLLGCKLFFYFSLFASCHSEVWRVSLQVFESKIDQKRCCFTLLLMKRTSTQQRRFMNTNYPTFSGTDVINPLSDFISRPHYLCKLGWNEEMKNSSFL